MLHAVSAPFSLKVSTHTRRIHRDVLTWLRESGWSILLEVQALHWAEPLGSHLFEQFIAITHSI